MAKKKPLIRQFLRLSRSRKILLCQAVVLQVAVRGALTLFPFRRVVRWFSGPQVAGEASRNEQDITWAVQAAAARIPGTTCLTNALVARFLLTHNGIETRLHIGVAKDSGRLDAHAWLTVADRVVIGEVDKMERFTLLPEISIKDS